MRILFTNEGTYPHVMGGVSTWCDQLVHGLSEHEFHLLAVTGPLAVKPAYTLPKNVTRLDTAHLWGPRKGLRRAGREQSEAFGAQLSSLLRFVDGDLGSFGQGLYTLAQAGTHHNVWPLFETEAAWREVRYALVRLLGRTPKLVETTLALNWLRASLAPLLFIPQEVDLAHTTANGLAAIPALLAAKTYGAPLLLTEHGVYLRERYLAFGAEDDVPGVRLLRARFHRAVAQLMYKEADRLLSVSEFNRRWQLELGAPVERTRVIYNGVEPGAFPAADGGVQKVPTVSWVGRIDPLKDLETLIRSFSAVRAVLSDARLKLYGPVPQGNEGYFAKLEQLVRQLSLERNVSFEGPISPVHKAYHAADVVVLSSVSEGFPYTPIEAMMCAKPVVATRVGGVGEAIGDSGKLVEPRQPEELGRALSELLLDASLRQALGAAARERALQHFTLSDMNGAYGQVYGELGTLGRAA